MWAAKERMPLYLTHGRLVLPSETILDGAVLVEDGVIRAVCPEARPVGAHEIDLHGLLLMPGIVDLHGDAIEKEVEPRDGANLPLDYAVVQADRKCALAGITTMYHSLSFGGSRNDRQNYPRVSDLAKRVYARAPYSTIDNRLHCRFELTSPDGMGYIRPLIDDGICTLVSLNDHTPGQGQYRDVESLRQYMHRNYGMGLAEIEEIIAEKRALAGFAEEHAVAMADYARAAGLPIASHDDDSEATVRKRFEQGSRISEFPINREAAQAATDLGMHVLVGAPNVLRGGSTGCGASAQELIALGIADALCSDYAPAALLPAAFRIAHELDWPLHRVSALLSTNPALAANLDDRGALSVGLRADLIAVQEQRGVPVVVGLWLEGRERLRLSLPGGGIA